MIYANRFAKQFFFETSIHGHKCEKSCELMKYLQEYGQKNKDVFAVLFPNCSAEIISGKMEQIDDKLALLSDDYPMSISYGAIYIEKGSKPSSDFVMAQADEKMYLLKNIRRLKKRNSVSGSGLKA